MKKNVYLVTLLLAIGLTGCGDSKRAASVEERSFESGLDTSFYFEMEPVDKAAYEVLKEEYEKVDFKADFQKGDESIYDEYAEKYMQLVHNEIPYYKDGDESYLKDSESTQDVYGNFIAEDNHYYIFDVDGDSRQELYVRTLTNRVYVFKYEKSDDKMYVWYEEENTPYYYFMGTQAKAWSNDGLAYVFYKLDENAKEAVRVTFEQVYDRNPKTNEGETVYLVKLPEYADSSINEEIEEELQEQAYCIDGTYYFCVTEEQFHELTAEFFEADSTVEERLAEVECDVTEQTSAEENNFILTIIENEMTDEDFEVEYNGYFINGQTTDEDIKRNLGIPEGFEDNNNGYIATIDDRWRWQLEYPDFTSQSDIRIIFDTNLDTDVTEIKMAALGNVATHRGIKVGDSKEDIYEKYGLPDEEKQYDANEEYLELDYVKGNQCLSFVVDESEMIKYIYIDYNL